LLQRCNTGWESERDRHLPIAFANADSKSTHWFNRSPLGARMKKIMLATVAGVALLAAAPAMAADLAVKAPRVAPVAPPPPAFSWTGCFIGAHWGWGWGRKDVHETAVDHVLVEDGEFPVFETHTFAASGDIDTSGAIFGGQVGCDYQFGFGKASGGPGGWVIGIQFDAAGTDIDGFRSDPFGEAFGAEAADLRIAVKQEFLASLTGRLGITGWGGGFWSQTLWYVRGGVAWTRDRWDLHGLNAEDGLLGIRELSPIFSPVNQNRTGWTVGVGWEWAFLPNWSAFVEWNHYDFGTKTLFTEFVSFPNGESFFADFDSKQRIETVKVGVNWRFNLFGKGKAPVVARY
jgi:outer membrane immunogenic protein